MIDHEKIIREQALEQAMIEEAEKREWENDSVDLLDQDIQISFDTYHGLEQYELGESFSIGATKLG